MKPNIIIKVIINHYDACFYANLSAFSIQLDSTDPPPAPKGATFSYALCFIAEGL
jgi:hypothetical protein